MDVTKRFPVGKEIAPGFNVTKAASKPVIADMANPIISFAEVKLDCLYENLAVLAFATFKQPPPQEQWIKLGLGGRETVRQFWQPKKIRQECLGVDYTRRAEPGHLMAVSHIISAQENILVSAQLLWFGFPLINRFYVGFKPGMRERAEELLLAGLKLT